MKNKKPVLQEKDGPPVIIDGYVQDRGELPDPEKLRKKGIWRKIPATLKVWFINAWFGGAVFFFVGWGIFNITSDQWDMVLVLGLVYGLVGDILINNIHMMALHPDELPKSHVIFHSKSFVSVIINCVYGLLLAVLISFAHGGINLAAEALGWAKEGGIWLGADPFIVGLMYSTFNLLFVLLRNLIMKIFKKNKTIKTNTQKSEDKT